MCESMKVFVTFRDNLIPIVWKSIVPSMALKNLEKEQARLHEELAQRERVV